ncbi:RidA family protein [Rhizobiaceae bacterium BDR2-2]|uniref:RidA family protein n=1 Tax=Ectorhizobium quercum TaxID=2965071 RepID=A0AAE3MY16_9HYPH|nr:RidA family protein [Ectorhizobium quercum]MCX8997123.1 RidA family protein [Ectorhizobium quercum]
MSRRLISSGSPFEKIAGYSRAVVQGDWVFVSGTAGYIKGETDPDDAAAQTRKAVEIVADALSQADAALADIVSLRIYAARREDIMAISEVLGETFGEIRPTNTTVVCGFVNDDIKVEIEAVALKH